MMAVLLFLFQFSMVFRDWKNTYDVNADYVVKTADGKNAWKQQTIDLNTNEVQSRNYLIFVGNAEGNMEQSVKQWCNYQKWNIAVTNSLGKIKEDLQTLPKMIVLESESYAQGKNLSKLESLEKKGVIVVFGSLDDVENIKKDAELMKFLGISKVVSDEINLKGVKLFDGLLLGGDAVYDATQSDDPQEKKRQDLNLNVPWYQVGSGTKTYMVGLLDKKKTKNGKKIKNEELPTIIWRNGIYHGSVFAVVGDYMKDSTALGLLDGMLSEASEYTLYPIVNAQNLSLVNLPQFANENSDRMMNIYSQQIVAMTRDTIWPSLISATEKSNMTMTCFLQPQSDYLDNIQPQKGNLKFYLKQMKEQNAEAGLSMIYKNADSLSQKQEEDQKFFEKENSSYKYGAAVVEHEKLNSLLEIVDQGFTKQISTITCEHTEEEPVVSYCTDSIILQSATNDGVDYKYSDDIRMRSIQSALGYTNIMYDFEKVFWPQKEEDQWQNVQKQLTGNLLTYWKNFSKFESTTLSKSNQRTRTFLNLDYYHSKVNDKIQLDTTHEKSWFLLRTNGREIKKIKGGSYKKIQNGVYLIYAKKNQVEIQLKHHSLHYYSKTD